METIETQFINILKEVMPEKMKIEIDTKTDLISELELDSLLLFQLVDVVNEQMGINLFEIDDFVSKFRNFGALCQAIRDR